MPYTCTTTTYQNLKYKLLKKRRLKVTSIDRQTDRDSEDDIDRMKEQTDRWINRQTADSQYKL